MPSNLVHLCWAIHAGASMLGLTCWAIHAGPYKLGHVGYAVHAGLKELKISKLPATQLEPRLIKAIGDRIL